MATSQIPDLWSDQILPAVATPKSLLEMQAKKLATHTNGLVVAEVTRSERTADTVSHHLVVRAPVRNFSQEVLEIRHHKMVVYPCTIHAEELESEFADEAEAYSPQQVLDALAQVLRSPRIVALVNSLVALSNDD
ncbi:hypothetical protein [Planctopirus hydrillae]|uniref:Uncharacterized protein n=1 Tax=Planctopirus hydrillae TaxID=1841610 RepID=A0A1C3E696_9PLAN|nr:hypothetical protein [Planctopirus hydrillae]ODA28760.1 hypothetical protein A6X21_10950 [Planctopirus hydrillae]